MSTKQHWAEFISKFGGAIIAIVIPATLGQMALWAYDESKGKKLSRREKTALFLASFAVGALIHKVCIDFGFSKYEWAIIWVSSANITQLLKFFYVKSGDIILEWLRTFLQNALNRISKKQDK